MEQQFIINKTTREIIEIVLSNIVKMLINRRWIILEETNELLIDRWKKSEKYKRIINELYSKINNNIREIYNIKIDKSENEVIVKINEYGIDEFINQYEQNHKIIVLKKDIQKSNKLYKTKNVEIFKEEKLMMDLVSIDYAPIEYNILTKEEEQTFLNEWNCTTNQIPRIKKSDPMVQYFNMKIGQIMRFVRTSKQTGLEIYYRICVP